MYEQGPLHFENPEQSTGIPSLVLNPNRWTFNATMIFLEAPAGVGFSYAANGNTATDDWQTANDNANAMADFFTTKFPELAKNKFYITGESYAGIYVPSLAYTIHNRNVAGASPQINLAGIMVGNGCVGNSVGACSAQGTAISVENLYGHGLYSEKTYNAIKSTCKDLSNPSLACDALLSEMSTEVGRINIYDMYTQCIEGNGDDASTLVHSRARRIPRRHIDEVMEPEGPVGCIDGIAAGQYLNHPSVREALHVKSDAEIGRWTICANIQYSSTIVDETQEIYPTLLKAIRVLVFNGDVDACVPYIGNEEWTSTMALRLGLSVSSPWHAWTVESPYGQQVAGYATNYDVPSPGSFEFVTVHGSGHMVPEFKPKEGLALFTRFMAGETF